MVGSGVVASRVPVEVRVHAFERFGAPLAGAEIAVRERPELRVVSDARGLARFWAAPGDAVTVRLERRRYQPIQTATVVVGEEGLVGAAAVTLQVPLALTFRALQRVLARPLPGRHHVATTVAALGKTLADCPQGEPGAELRVRSPAGEAAPCDRPIYLGAVPLVHKTDFAGALLAALGLRAPLERTSADGGVLIANVPRGRWVLGASKPGVRFTSAEIVIAEDSPALINVSPPQGPRVIG